MIKIHNIVREILMADVEAGAALSNGYMNMTSYAEQIRPEVKYLTKKEVTLTSIVVALSRIRGEFKKNKPLIHDVVLTNITTKLPLIEIVFEKNEKLLLNLESIHSDIGLDGKDFFTTTVSTTEINIICSSSYETKILKYFKVKPKIIVHNLAAVSLSFNPEEFKTPNTFFSLMYLLAKSSINIAEIISTYTELTFIVDEKDFARTVSEFSLLFNNKKTI